MESTIVYDDEELRVVHFQGASKFLLITFNELSKLANDDWFWARPLAEKARISTLGFVTKRKSWFPKQNMILAMAACIPILSLFREKVLYGFSMGGYAVLKYGKHFDPTVALSFAPQFSIRPDDVPFETRWPALFNDVDRDMAVQSDDVPDRTYMFYDPFYRADKGHVDLILRRKPDIVCFPVYMTAHSVIWPLAKTDVAIRLFEAALIDDRTAVSALVNRARRRSPTRIVAAAHMCISKRPRTALAIFRKHRTAFTDVAEREFLFYLSRHHRNQSENHYKSAQYEPALNSALVAVDAIRDATSLNLLGGAYMNLRRFDEAEAAVREAAELAPANPSVLCRLSDILRRKGDLEQALAFAETARNHSPDKAFVHRQIALLFMTLHDWPSALASISEALRLEPDHAGARDQHKRITGQMRQKSG